ENNRVLEVVTVPGHERDRDVRAQCELPEFRGRSIGGNVARFHLLTTTHQRTLVDRGVLVGAPILLDLVTVVLRQASERTIRVLLAADSSGARVRDDLVGGDACNCSRTLRDDDCA